MSRASLLTIGLAGLLAVTGCGGGSSSGQSGGAPAADANVSRYDDGPRAAAAPVNESLAKRGDELFKSKGCSACHAFGQKLSGPDLAGVTSRRTAEWMRQQILHPDVMTKEDPISRELMMKHALQMPNQGLTEDEAEAVIEYLKTRDPNVSSDD